MGLADAFVKSLFGCSGCHKNVSNLAVLGTREQDDVERALTSEARTELGEER